MIEDAFEPTYSPRKIEFWLRHWEELAGLVYSPKTSAHIAAHLADEWMHLQVRLLSCLCHEQHLADSLAVDPACQHQPSGGGGYRKSSETALCIYSDLMAASATLPAHWSATQRIWKEQGLTQRAIAGRCANAAGGWPNRTTYREPEPTFARHAAVERMAQVLGWSRRVAA